LLAKAVAQEELSRQEAYQLVRARASELPALMLAASLVRDRHKGNLVTYSRKAFIPLTNLCRNTCGYCTFVRQPDDPQAHTMTPEEVLTVANAARSAGCKEALLSLGDKPEDKYPEYRRWLEQRSTPAWASWWRTSALACSVPGRPTIAARTRSPSAGSPRWNTPAR